MFAPLIMMPQAKTAVRPSDKSALTRATTDHDREIEREHTSERTRQTCPRLSNKESAVSWDFSKIPLYPQGRRDGPDRLSSASAPHLPGPTQRQLKIGAANEPLEHEADLVADQVMRMPDPWVSVGTAQPQISRKCDASEQGEELQKRAAGRQAVISGVPSSVHEVLRMPGEPLDATTRAYFEPRFGRDFSGVRVHADAAAARSAREVNARAYTVGHNIVFDSGRFATASQAGRHLIAHELMHVVQQGQGKPLLQREPLRDPKPRWVSPESGDVQPAEPVYDIAVNPNNVDWRGQNHTLQEALDEAFKKVCYDDNGVSTGIAKDQLHESAWVKTSYGKTVPVEWTGPGNAEVSIDVAHIPPGPDIPHVGWQRPGKGGSGHIFLDETPYGRPPLNVPPAEYPSEKAAKNASTKAKKAGTQATAKVEQAAEKVGTEATPKLEQAATETAVKAGAEGALTRGLGATALEVVFDPALMLGWEVLKGISSDYQQGWDDIRRPARHIGFAQGWAARLAGLGISWIKWNLAPQFVDRSDVATEALEATGMAEHAYIVGLGEGFRYGAGYSDAMKAKKLGQAFEKIEARHEEVHFDTDNFLTRNSLILVAAMLQQEADRAISRWDDLREQRKKAAEREADFKRRSENWTGHMQ